MAEHRRALFVLFAVMLAATTLAVLLPADAQAQCALCRTGLQNGDGTARTMNLAILVLLIPPVAIFCSIFGVAYKKIKKDDKEGE
ncbi:MAG TPA: hypothetical protein VEX60_15495 [Pyrinomonadaceae bacterium]|nr:hypothetical protein [Pyrinomonadaceae bacterium]